MNRGVYNPAINIVYFPNIMSVYWSFSSYANTRNNSDPNNWDGDDAWDVNFYDGFVRMDHKWQSGKLIAVRGSQLLSPVFTYTPQNGTVTDTKTGLMWQQETGNNGSAMAWKAALAYCASLPLNGYTDWRLPNIKELASLVDFSRYNPAIDKRYFPDTKSSDYYWSSYWSSSTYAYDISYVWSVNFYFGYDTYDSYKSSSNYVRCVRGGTVSNGGTSFDKGDLNHLNGIDLADAILALKVVCGLNQSGIFLDTEVNADGKVGLEEVIYILQKVAGLR